MPGGSPPTQATAVPKLQTAVVALPAEIDAANVGMVEAVLIADGTTTVFCDSSGVAALIRAHHQAASAGAQLRVVITGASVRRVLELTGADQLLLVYPSLSGAQAERSQPAPSAADPASDPENQEIA